ncbi:endothelin-converting enzyme 1-like [Leptopilina boulardi]|uniref:endothelin-converting enzyme 1-like n=1 Tax=Leptopilina boulardi TaxID=63433 RepID=UPI0021F63E26|nr:endothelin-converting enzyme 1-like [Leptopilina boulardi]
MFDTHYLIFAVHLIILLIINEEKTLVFGSDVENNISEVCETKECHSLAELIKKGMNDSVNPCDDFYSYVCGSWQSNYPVPKGKQNWDLFEISTEERKFILKDIIEKPLSSEDTEPLVFEKKWYNSCMDEDRIKKKGLEPLKKIIDKIGGWPMVMNTTEWEKKEITWQDVVYYYVDIVGGYGLFTIGTSSNPKNSTLHMIAITQENKFLPNINFLNDMESSDYNNQFISYSNGNNDNNDDITKFQNFLNKAISKYSESEGMRDEKKIEIDSRNLFDFINSLEKIKLTLNERREFGYEIMRISDFQNLYNHNNTNESTISKINWLEMIKAVYNNTDVVIDESEKIIVLDKTYFNKLSQLLEKTDQRTIVNYIHWMFIVETLPYLDKEIKQFIYDTKKTADVGIIKPSERWEYCFDSLPFNFGTSFEFIKRQFPNTTKESATTMAKEIQHEIEVQMSNSNWLNNETKNLVKEKLKAIKVVIGYSESFFSEINSSDEHINDEVPLGPDYFENKIAFFKHIRFEAAKNIRELKSNVSEPVIMSPLTYNAGYELSTNSLNVAAALLSLPIYNLNLPLAINYGYIGYIMGHEMTHGFDDQGRKYDKNGNRIPWWSDEMIDEYEKRAKCFVDHYNNYKVDGKLTQGETIADTGGLIAAYGAYKQKMKKENIKDKRLPGLENLDLDQLYFVSMAFVNCESGTPEYLARINTDVHPKSNLRINGLMANVKGFSDAFKCDKEPICKIWD